ncbi:MAG: glycosyltransferase [Bryobacteraceae bacterium]
MIATAVFLLSLAAFLYIMAGYPLLLTLLARRRPKPVARRPIECPVTIVVAVHNGAEYLAAKLDSIRALDWPAELKQVIVASDGSTDATESIAASYGVELLRLPRAGKCAALNAAFTKVRGEIVLLTDVRQSLAPDSLRLLAANFADPTVGVCSGDLMIRPGSRSDEAEIGLYRRFETWMRDALSSLDSMFGATGAIYAVRRSLVVPIPEDMLLDDMYLPLAGAFRSGYRLVMERRAVAWDIPTGRDVEFRRKVRTLAGNYQLLMRQPWLLTRENRMLWHFLSYKVARLALPFLLASLLVSSFWLPSPWALPIAGGQLLFYLLAAAHPLLPGPLRRISSPARTFVVMMVAGIKALSVFFVPPKTLWKATGAGRS